MNEERHDRENRVRAHYDEPPELFACFLDPDMHYSTGFFTEPNASLSDAQAVKVDRYTQWMAVREAGTYLDVGSGWGALAVAWAKVPHVRVTGLTLSPHQAAYAVGRSERAGVADRTQFLIQPFLDRSPEPDHYDGISFIGSIAHMQEREAVWQSVATALRPGGRAVVSDTYRPHAHSAGLEDRPARFVLEGTFGFGHAIPLSEELRAMEDAGLRVLYVEESSAHYVRTLDAWLERLRAGKERVEAIRPGAYRSLRAYLQMSRLSFRRDTMRQYEIVAERPGG